MEDRMNLEWRISKDFWAGVMFLVIGIVAMSIAHSYPFGATFRMGPGYFPSVVGGVLICLGIVLMVKGLRRLDRIVWNWSLRALIVLPIVLIAFGLLIDRVGLIPSLGVVVIGSAAASPEFRWGEVLLLTVGITFLVVAVFIWGLGLPYHLFKFF
jgi:hypothetical protein